MSITKKSKKTRLKSATLCGSSNDIKIKNIRLKNLIIKVFLNPLKFQPTSKRNIINKK